ncbi:hypothetical protein, partial [Rivihabitans pingtungensis]|uniref:hypothetical protein n=1 Tax=Rivihabitans pingtungensis TaxID=1054498 RepID=UPI0023F246E2
MLQKLENIYLNILRFVVILVASILLVVVAFTGINALLAMRLEPVPKDIVPKVPAQSLVDELTHSEAASTLGKPATTLQPTKGCYTKADSTLLHQYVQGVPSNSINEYEQKLYLLASNT